MKLERLISMIYKLLNHEVLPASVLADEFQVSKRTIYRDIDTICAAGIPVISYEGSKGGYGIIEGYKMEKSLLGSYDVSLLITILKSLSSVFEDDRAKGTIERLQAIEPKHKFSTLSLDFETNRIETNALLYLRAGINEQRIVRFNYVNSKNKRTMRKLEPVHLYFKYHNWYIYGFCKSRQAYRDFRISRMMNLNLTEESFQRHHKMSTESTDSKNTDYGHLENVVFHVKPDSLAEVMDKFPQADKQFNVDGSVTMCLPVFKPLQAHWLWAILLGFGSGTEVVEPRKLREILKEKLQETLKIYE